MRQNENGSIKSVKEIYLVDALSFTEVEARLTKELSASNRQITVNAIKRSDIAELVLVGDTEQFFKVKFTYTVNDDESEKAKKITRVLLVNADTIEEANTRTASHLSEMLVPWEVTKAEKSKIVEVFEYVGKHPKLAASKEGKTIDNGGWDEEDSKDEEE